MTRIQQELPNFQLQKSAEIITSKSGLSLFHEAATSLGMIDSIKNNLPCPGSNRGLKPTEYVMPLVLMFCGGGRTMEDIREIERDKGLRKLCGFNKIPSADAIGEWLRKPGRLEGLGRTKEQFTKTIILRSGKDNFILDTDATLIESEKTCAEMTYKGFTAFSALLSFIADLDLCVCDDFRNGAVHAGQGITEQIKHTNDLLKTLGKTLKYFRSDSAAYEAKVLNFCAENKIIYTVTADQDASVKTAIADIKKAEWKPLYDEGSNLTDREYATTVHCMEKSAEAFTLIVQRWQNPQRNLFEPDKYRYYVIATNDYERETPMIIRFHNKRGNSENYNKELKNGFGMDYMPSRELKANAVYFRLGVLAYNLTVAIKKLFLGEDWATKTIATLRWQFIFVAGKIVEHGRQLFLQIADGYFELLQTIRQKIRAQPICV